jgi:DNA repair exonuclease SbcCD nuclease subunit
MTKLSKSKGDVIAFTADNHLRDAQYGRLSRGRDFKDAFTAVVSTALARKPSAIICGGDLIDSTRPSAAVMSFLGDIHARLVRENVPMLITSGNHDLTKPHWIQSVAPDGNGTTPGMSVIDNMKVTLPGGTVVMGLPFMSPEEFAQSVPATLEGVDVLVFHGPVLEFVPDPSMRSIPMDSFPKGPRVILLGDIHIRSWRKNAAGQLIGYPGSTELCSFGEELDKSFEIVTVPAEGEVTLEQVPIPTRKAVPLKIDDNKQLEAAVDKLRSIAHLNPLVFCKYAHDVEGVIERLSSVLDMSVAILRGRRMPKPGVVSIERGRIVARKPAEFMSRFLPPGNQLHDIGIALCDEGADASQIIDAYIAM